MQRLGIHKRWNRRYLLNEVASRIPEHAGLSSERLAESIANHAKDTAAVSLFSAGDIDCDFREAIFGLESSSRLLLRRDQYAKYAEVVRAISPLDAASHQWVLQRLLYLGRNIATLGKLNVWTTTLRDISETLAMSYSMGWNNAADRIGAWTLQLLPFGLCWGKDDWDPRWEKRREPFARFVVALYADFARMDLPAMPPHPYEAPVYEALLACWRDPDPASLVETLLAACDWHTHECMYSRSDKPSKNVDFINDILMGWPVEVHMVYRLRERLGLPLPVELDHPLMKTPLGPFLPPQPVPRDDVLDRLMQRAFCEIPGLRELVEPAITDDDHRR